MFELRLEGIRERQMGLVRLVETLAGGGGGGGEALTFWLSEAHWKICLEPH